MGNIKRARLIQFRQGKCSMRLKLLIQASRAKDSERIISELRREIHDLKQEAGGRSPAKERLRNRVNASKRKNPEHTTLSHNSRSEDFSETSCS
jgi:hypothetical protein